MSFNKCTFSGNIGKDVEVRDAGGNKVANFSIAVNGFKKEDPAMWVNCSLWGKRAEGRLTSYLKKGQPVIVCGELKVREYESNGKQGHSVDLNVSDVELMGGRDSAVSTDAANDDDVPFDAAEGL